MIDNDIDRLIDTDTIKLFKDGVLTDVDASVVNECHFAIFLNDTYYSDNTGWGESGAVAVVKGESAFMPELLAACS